MGSFKHAPNINGHFLKWHQGHQGHQVGVDDDDQFLDEKSHISCAKTLCLTKSYVMETPKHTCLHQITVCSIHAGRERDLEEVYPRNLSVASMTFLVFRSRPAIDWLSHAGTKSWDLSFDQLFENVYVWVLVGAHAANGSFWFQAWEMGEANQATQELLKTTTNY